jgi:hypothetical protein
MMALGSYVYMPIGTCVRTWLNPSEHVKLEILINYLPRSLIWVDTYIHRVSR